MTDRRVQGGVPAAPGREFLRLGVVIRAQGLEGALEVKPDWSGSRGLLEAAEVVLQAPDGRREQLRVKSARSTPKGVMVRLAGIDDRTRADERRGHVVLVSREALPRLEAGEYYLSDLVGLTVFVSSREVGKVVEIQVYPSVDAVVIEAPSGERWEQPLLDQWLERVDVAAGVVVLSSDEGLIEAPRALTGERSLPPRSG